MSRVPPDLDISADAPALSVTMKRMGVFPSLDHLALSLTDLLRPPDRMTVSQAAAKYRWVNNPGAYVGPWRNEMVQYMVEPMDTLTASEFKGLAFVGGAQSSKTDSLMLNWVTYSVVVDPMDITLYSPSTGAARDFSNRRIDRLHRHTKPVGDALRPTRDADNKFDKHYASGMMLSLSWPSPTEFAGKPIPRVGLTDYDRMDDDIEGDGNPFDLASKRTTTFGSFAMCLAESSPSKPLLDPKWIPRSPHEAPPATGIFALYNRGDRRRWYWPCPHCSMYFEGKFDMLEWDEGADDMSTAGTVRMICPTCAKPIHPDERYEMNLWGVWLREGEYMTRDGRRAGIGRRSSIASFWLRGVAAAFVNWRQLVETYLTAKREFETTNDEGALRKFFNNDLAEVYMSKSQDSGMLPEVLKSRAEDLGDRDVPVGVRFLVAVVDVQKNMFVVQVFGIAPGTPHDVVVIDRFSIVKSKRRDHDDERLWVKPSSYLEDWDLLTEEVMDKTYPLSDGSGRHMGVKLTLCDSGGYQKKRGKGKGKGESATAKAYDFYRKLRSENRHGRFHLVKGDSSPNAPTTRITYPDAQQKDRLSAARGDVPVLLLNPNSIKDNLHGRLDCLEPGKGIFRFPDWLPNWFYQEMCAEVRTPTGWENPTGARNEAWDLCGYLLAGCLSPLLMVRGIDWANPPGWAAEWDKNDLVTEPGVIKAFDANDDAPYDLAKLAARLA